MGSYVFKIATQEPEKLLAAVSESLGANSRIAKQVAEQMPKPAIAEPETFGSVVRATSVLHPKVLWQKTPMHGKHYWESETGAVEVWSELTNVEVLRIGVGEAEQPAGFCTCYPNEKAPDCGVSEHRRAARIYRDPMDDAPEAALRVGVGAQGVTREDLAYTKGAEDFAAKMRRELAALKKTVVTGPEKRAVQDAEALVAALLGDS